MLRQSRVEKLFDKKALEQFLLISLFEIAGTDSMNNKNKIV